MAGEVLRTDKYDTIYYRVRAPDGSTLEYTQRYMQAIERIGMTYPEFDRVFVVTGNPTVSQGIAILRTVDWSERDRSTVEAARALQPLRVRLWVDFLRAHYARADYWLKTGG